MKRCASTSFSEEQPTSRIRLNNSPISAENVTCERNEKEHHQQTQKITFAQQCLEHGIDGPGQFAVSLEVSPFLSTADRFSAFDAFRCYHRTVNWNNGRTWLCAKKSKGRSIVARKIQIDDNLTSQDKRDLKRVWHRLVKLSAISGNAKMFKFFLDSATLKNHYGSHVCVTAFKTSEIDFIINLTVRSGDEATVYTMLSFILEKNRKYKKRRLVGLCQAIVESGNESLMGIFEVLFNIYMVPIAESIIYGAVVGKNLTMLRFLITRSLRLTPIFEVENPVCEVEASSVLLSNCCDFVDITSFSNLSQKFSDAFEIHAPDFKFSDEYLEFLDFDFWMPYDIFQACVFKPAFAQKDRCILYNRGSHLINAITLASVVGHTEAIKLLHSMFPKELVSWKVASEAARRGHLDTFKYLMENEKFGIKWWNDDKCLLEYAIRHRHYDIVRYCRSRCCPTGSAKDQDSEVLCTNLAIKKLDVVSLRILRDNSYEGDIFPLANDAITSTLYNAFKEKCLQKYGETQSDEQCDAQKKEQQKEHNVLELVKFLLDEGCKCETFLNKTDRALRHLGPTPVGKKDKKKMSTALYALIFDCPDILNMLVNDQNFRWNEEFFYYTVKEGAVNSFMWLVDQLKTSPNPHFLSKHDFWNDEKVMRQIVLRIALSQHKISKEAKSDDLPLYHNQNIILQWLVDKWDGCCLKSDIYDEVRKVFSLSAKERKNENAKHMKSENALTCFLLKNNVPPSATLCYHLCDSMHLRCSKSKWQISEHFDTLKLARTLNAPWKGEEIELVLKNLRMYPHRNPEYGGHIPEHLTKDEESKSKLLVEIFEYIIIDQSCPCIQDSPIFEWAAQFNCPDIIEMLYTSEYGVLARTRNQALSYFPGCVNNPGIETIQSILSTAAKNGSLEVLLHMYGSGECATNWPYSIINDALIFGRYECLLWMLSVGVQVQSTDFSFYGKTRLYGFNSIIRENVGKCNELLSAHVSETMEMHYRLPRILNGMCFSNSEIIGCIDNPDKSMYNTSTIAFSSFKEVFCACLTLRDETRNALNLYQKAKEDGERLKKRLRLFIGHLQIKDPGLLDILRCEEYDKYNLLTIISSSPSLNKSISVEIRKATKVWNYKKYRSYLMSEKGFDFIDSNSNDKGHFFLDFSESKHSGKVGFDIQSLKSIDICLQYGTQTNGKLAYKSINVNIEVPLMDKKEIKKTSDKMEIDEADKMKKEIKKTSDKMETDEADPWVYDEGKNYFLWNNGKESLAEVLREDPNCYEIYEYGEDDDLEINHKLKLYADNLICLEEYISMQLKEKTVKENIENDGNKCNNQISEISDKKKAKNGNSKPQIKISKLTHEITRYPQEILMKACEALRAAKRICAAEEAGLKFVKESFEDAKRYRKEMDERRRERDDEQWEY